MFENQYWRIYQKGDDLQEYLGFAIGDAVERNGSTYFVDEIWESKQTDCDRIMPWHLSVVGMGRDGSFGFTSIHEGNKSEWRKIDLLCKGDGYIPAKDMGLKQKLRWFKTDHPKEFRNYAEERKARKKEQWFVHYGDDPELEEILND